MAVVPFNEILGVVKSALKKRGLTYKDLAEELEIPESTLKKQFAASDWSYERLGRVCDVLGLDLTDILISLENRQVTEVAFLVEQEEAFAADPLLFRVYWQIVFEQQSVHQVRASNNLGKDQMFRLLRQLDTLKLLELLPGDAIRTPGIKPVRWSNKSQFVRDVRRTWSRETVLAAEELEDSGQGHLWLQYFQIARHNYKDLVEALRTLEEDFAKRTARDLSIGEEIVRVRCAVALAEGSFL